MNKLAGFWIAGVTQVDDEEDFMPKNCKEYKERLDQEEILEFDNYQHDLDSQEYIYESDYVSDDEKVDGTDNNDDDECMTEVKDPDLDDQRNISSHHNGICLMQTDRSATGLNLKNCVLLDSQSTVHAFCNSNLLEDIWA